MSSIVISGDTSGAITLQAPAVAGTTTHTLPATTGTVLNDATCGVCRAWVNFNGTGTVAIRGSYNVSSITDNGTGNYTINFTSALSDTNYAVIGITGEASLSNGNINIASTLGGASLLTTSAKVYSLNATNALADMTYVNVSIFR